MSGTKDRRRKLLDQSPSVLNGIDYVAIANRQKTALLVHFLTSVAVANTVTLTTITGGQTIASVAVTSTAWSTDTAGRPLLTLTVAAPGDSSTYTLSLTSPVLDPYFSNARFSFTAGEPSTIDCKTPVPVEPVPSSTAPPIDYLAKDFLSFRKALSDFSTLAYPAWQERSEADFGVMFMEALCSLGDDFSYQQDRIAAEAYLATATERLSVVRHARLVNYEPTPALASSVTLQFTVYGATTVIPPGMAVNANGPDGTPIYFETGTSLADTQQYLANPQRYLANTKQYQANLNWNTITPYWWDASTQILGAGATEMWVVSHGLGLAAGVSLLLDTTPSEVGLANIREIVQLQSVDEQTDQLYNAAVTHLVFQPPLSDQHDLAVTTVKGNLIPATQGLHYDESFAIDSAPAGVPLAVVRTGPNQTPQYLYTLGNAPLTWLASSADPSVTQLPEIIVTQQPSPDDNSASKWIWYQSLLDAPSFASGFTIDPVRLTQLPPELADGTIQQDYDGSNGDTLRFGDGDFGEIPVSGLVFGVTYRAGGGSAGNVAADSITTINSTGPLAALASAVTNPFAASGAAGAESLDMVRRLAPYAYQTQQANAVLPADFAAAAKTLPWVGRAACTIRYTGSWLTAFTTAEPLAAAFPTDSQSSQLAELLDRYRMAGHESFVLPPKYIPLDLQIFATAEPNAFNSNVYAAILEALSTQALPNGGLGFFAHSNFTFGQPLERSALEAAIQHTQGVAGVTSIRYRRHGLTTEYVEMTDQVSTGIDEIIRVDNDPAKPDAGSIILTVAGGK